MASRAEHELKRWGCHGRDDRQYGARSREDQAVRMLRRSAPLYSARRPLRLSTRRTGPKELPTARNTKASRVAL